MEKVDINILRENDSVNFINEDRSIFFGKIKKIQNNCLAVTINTNQDNFNLLNNKKRVQYILAFQHEAIRCSSEILGSQFTDQFQFVLLDQPTVINTIERRQFERVQTIMDIDYCILPSDSTYNKLSEVPSMHFKRLKKSFTVDISAGGVRLVVYEDNIEQRQALVSMRIKETQVLSLCSVIRYELINGEKNNRAALKYVDIDNNSRVIISRFVEEKLK